ncbi:hypothetical protein GCM10028805_22910 [Spirosoma harenae]
MKSILHKLNFIPSMGILLTLIALSTSCEQQSYEPNTSVAPGGGTVTTYKAYTLASTDGKNIYGRVVFYKYSATVTLVEIGLYNTTTGTSYASSIYQGKLSGGSATALKPLDTISGATGEFSTNKYFTISEAGFYDKLGAYDANVKIMLGTTLVASGNIGANATPVAQS